MGFSQGRNTVDLDDILRSVREIDILSYYLGISYIPCVINSPLRPDKNPSFGLYSHNGKKIRFTDLANGDRGDTFDLLSQKWKLSFNETLSKIKNDLKYIGNQEISKVNSLNSSKSTKTFNFDTTLECKIREWREYDLEYWQQFGISLPWLKFGDIYPISHIIITKVKSVYNIPADKYAYSYVERKDGKVSLKIYQPFNEDFKWSNKHDSSVWDLWTKLPDEGDKLIITSSRKDALSIWENTGIPCLSLQAESNMPKKHVVNQLKDRFKNIYVLYDNDFDSEVNKGRILGKRLADEHNLKQIEIPDKYMSKDSSDLYKNCGKKLLRKVIYKLIGYDNINNGSITEC